MAEPLLLLSGVGCRFGGVRALDGVDLQVDQGGVHALIGPNGAGKTTLIHQISGALRPDAGSVRFAGRDVTRVAMHKRVALGIARSYQVTNIFARLSVRENLTLAVEARTRHCGGEVERVIGRVGLGDAADRTAGSLSYGEQRQLEVGLALAAAPRLLLLDEPLAGLGPEESVRMEALVAELSREVTILLVEHDMDAVFRLAGRVSVLVEGRVAASGTPDEVRADPGVRRAYLGDAP